MHIVVVYEGGSGVDSNDSYDDDECMINGNGDGGGGRRRRCRRGWITGDELRIVGANNNWIEPNRLWYIDVDVANFV